MKHTGIFSLAIATLFTLYAPIFPRKVAEPAAPTKKLSQVKDWNFVVYIAGNNNLYKFVQRNIDQMKAIGSNEHINILVQLDRWGHRKTMRYYITPGSHEVVEDHDTTPHNASGTTASLFDCMKWATENYPAKHTALILWNHGSGILDPHIWGRLLNQDRDELFFFNPVTCKLELDRSPILRGIAFNDTFETYISNQDLKETLEDISHKLLGGKKIDILGMDACHMAMVEVGSQVKSSVDLIVASEEIEPGNGWHYTRFLKKFTKGTLSPENFAREIVNAYEEEYCNVTCDFTQSAFSLKQLDKLEKSISNVADVFIKMLKSEVGGSIAATLKSIRESYQYTTVFYNHNYIDLGHLFKSLLLNVDKFSIAGKTEQECSLLVDHIQTSLAIIDEMVIANSTGMSLRNALGISIYFPTRNIHTSYLKTVFAQSTSWIDLMAAYLNKTWAVRSDVSAIADIAQELGGRSTS